jgi:hypothetical protein
MNDIWRRCRGSEWGHGGSRIRHLGDWDQYSSREGWGKFVVGSIEQRAGTESAMSHRDTVLPFMPRQLAKSKISG